MRRAFLSSMTRSNPRVTATAIAAASPSPSASTAGLPTMSRKRSNSSPARETIETGEVIWHRGCLLPQNIAPVTRWRLISVTTRMAWDSQGDEDGFHHLGRQQVDQNACVKDQTA